MDYAIDKSTELLVSADKATRGKRYRCPNPKCGADCHLRSGDERRYFAHNSGKANKDCDNYHPGNNGFWSGSSTRRDREPARRSLNLYFHVMAGSSRASTWKISLLIPEAADGSGAVVIPAGLRGSVHLPFSQLNQGGRRVDVRVQTEQYQIEIRGKADLAFTERAVRPIPGFNRNKWSVFRYSHNGGRRLAEDQPLYWGRAYCLVWAQGTDSGWWPIGMQRHELLRNGIWQGTIVVLPPDEDRQTSEWIKRTLDRKVVQPPVIMTLVAPAETSEMEDESSVVASDTEVLVGIFGERGARVPSSLEVLYAGKNSALTVAIPRFLPAVVSLGKLPQGRTEVWIPDDPDAELSFVTAPLNDRSLNLPDVRLLIKDDRGGHNGVSLFSELAFEILQLVRKGQAHLSGICVPERVSGTLRFRQQRDQGWYEVPLQRNLDTNGSEEQSAFENRVGQIIQEHLLQTTKVVQIDFGNLGTLTLDVPQQASVVSQGLVLPAKVRDQLIWLFSTPQPNVAGPSTGPIREIQLSRRSPEFHALSVADQRLIERLENRKTWSVTLEPHVRRVIRALTDAGIYR